MLTKEESKVQKQLFWLKFDQYCDTIPALAYRKKKWILYDTKISHVDLKFDVCNNSAIVALELNHRSEYRRFQAFEVVEKYKILLSEGFMGGLIWDFCYLNENQQEVCRIYTEKVNLNIYKTSDWTSFYEFFCDNMLQLQDNFLEIQEALQDELTLLLREQ